MLLDSIDVSICPIAGTVSETLFHNTKLKELMDHTWAKCLFNSRTISEPEKKFFNLHYKITILQKSFNLGIDGVITLIEFQLVTSTFSYIIFF